ncbi:zinc ABC transporter substrate-binding protein [Radicibacter daui]|uniref:zinc ABC transporter substrate-binding protein n=1 Tax=Radicibacter daui TaxID=3064829 RepID=UPI004046C6D2
MPRLSSRPTRFAAAALAATLLWSAQALAAPPSVVATIKPVAAIAAALMQGTQAKPHLLVDGNSSPHVYSLKPSDASALQRADLILWVGPGLETFLGEALTTLPQHARVLELMKAPGLQLLPYHTGNEWEPDDDDHDHDHGHDHGQENNLTEEAHTDPHLWLNPANVSAMAEMVANALGDLAPENRALYASNLAALRQQLTSVDDQVRTELAPVKSHPFIVFHDGYQYLASHYGLANVGSITLSADREPGASRVLALRKRFEAQQVTCLFTEPQFEPRLARTITESTKARVGTLDPLGATLPVNENYYPKLYEALAKSLTACLG